MAGSALLRHELSARGRALAASRALRCTLTNGEIPSVIFGTDANGRHGNFHPTSYRNICANPAWSRRLAKLHTGYKRACPRSDWNWRELDSANSSDALLMNVFCYRRRLTNQALCAMLGVEVGFLPEFGFKPGVPLRNGKVDRTETDMRLGSLLVEAKLTESGFQTARVQLVERYRDFDEVFDTSQLTKSNDLIRNYQLLRGVLAAHATGGSFCVICDARRPDLIECWFSVLTAVRDCTLRYRLRLLTWQEICTTLPGTLQRFLAVKYGIAMRD